MLHLAAIADDEPVAVAPARPDAEKFDARAINRRAVRVWPTLRNLLVGMHGRPNGDIWRLNPANPPLEPGRPLPHGSPQIRELRGPSPYETDGSGPGDWRDVGTGASGPDVISLIQYLSNGADRRVCADYLARLLSRIVEIAA